MQSQFDRAVAVVNVVLQIVVVALTGAFLKVNYDMLSNMRDALAFGITAQHTLERGWLAADPIPFDETRIPEVGPNVFELALENVGRSPVRDVVVDVNPALAATVPPTGNWREAAGRSRSRLVVGPASRTFMVARYTLSPDGASEIVSRAKTLYISGYVAYNTICESATEMSRERQHVTQLCYEYDPRARRWWKCDVGNTAL